MNIADIKRIRWTCSEARNTRWYGFSKSIMLDEKYDGRSAVISKEVDEHNWCGLTVLGRKLVNKILRMHGVRILWAQAHSITVEIVPVFDWEDGFHEDILSLLNRSLFNGKATIVGPDSRGRSWREPGASSIAEP